MNYVIKLFRAKNKAYKIVLPNGLTNKYAWSKEDVYLIWRYDEKILIIEPIKDVDFKTYFTGDGNTSLLYHYSKPLKEAVQYAFYVPIDILRANKWEDLKLLAVHDSGAKPIILEAFPNGTKNRQKL